MSEARHLAVEAASLTVTASYDMRGSILAGTAEHRAHSFETVLEVSANAPEADVAAMVATAERMCFVLDAIQRPHAVKRRVVVNGAPLTGESADGQSGDAEVRG